MSSRDPEEVAEALKALVSARASAEKRLDQMFDSLQRSLVRVKWDEIGMRSFPGESTALVLKVDRTRGLEKLHLFVFGRKEIETIPVEKITSLEILVSNDESPLLYASKLEEIFAEVAEELRGRIQQAIDYHLSQVD